MIPVTNGYNHLSVGTKPLRVINIVSTEDEDSISLKLVIELVRQTMTYQT